MTEKVTGDLARREHSGGQNNQDEVEEKQLLNIQESQPSDQSNNRFAILVAQIPIVQAARKPWRFTKLQFIDISVNVQKLIPTVRVPHVQHKDKSPMRTVQKAQQGTENCGSSLKE